MSINSTNPVPARLQTLRAAMHQHGIDFAWLPSSDPHLSEYLPAHWQSREYFSGFTGSMATLVVGKTQAVLFADSRYWSQAERELAGSGIELFKIKSGASAEHVGWLAAQGSGKVVAVDGAVAGVAAARAMQAALAGANSSLRCDIDLCALAWNERPALPTQAVYAHDSAFADLPRGAKLAAIRADMAAANTNTHVISTLDDLAYAFNLRGSDVGFNPVFVGHAIVGMTQATLYVGANKISAELAAELAADNVAVADYALFSQALGALPNTACVLVDAKRITHQTLHAINPGARLHEAMNPSTLHKAQKTSAQAQFVRDAMVQDGVAMAEFYAWFESVLGRERITEIGIDQRITAERAKRPGFVGPSFATIAGFNANGALPHYRAIAGSESVIEGNGLLLIDSGGQYLGGTTDITRVWPIGEVSAEQKRDYTLVLKGTIALSVAQFPLGTPSPFLDAIARAPLWAHGLNYGHGTGHGVGYFLNVHEGPQSLSQAMPEPHTAMLSGMVTSIEPGLYREGRWGIRIENLVLNVPAGDAGFGQFLKFETLTLCPIEVSCIDKTLLSAAEIAWLNAYHATVRAKLKPWLSEAAADWLVRKTEAI